MVTLDTLRALHAARSQTRGVLPDVRVPPCSLAPGPPTGVLTQIATAAPTVARWLVAAVAALFASAAGAEVRYIPLGKFAAGDKPGDVASYSEAVLTEYRFQSGGHSYAMARALRATRS